MLKFPIMAWLCQGSYPGRGSLLCSWISQVGKGEFRVHSQSQHSSTKAFLPHCFLSIWNYRHFKNVSSLSCRVWRAKNSFPYAEKERVEEGESSLMYSFFFFHGKQSHKILPLFIVKGVPCWEICKQLGEPHGNRNLKDLLSCKRSEEGSLLAARAASTLGFLRSGVNARLIPNPSHRSLGLQLLWRSRSLQKGSPKLHGLGQN